MNRLTDEQITWLETQSFPDAVPQPGPEGLPQFLTHWGNKDHPTPISALANALRAANATLDRLRMDSTAIQFAHWFPKYAGSATSFCHSDMMAAFLAGVRAASRVDPLPLVATEAPPSLTGETAWEIHRMPPRKSDYYHGEQPFTEEMRKFLKLGRLYRAKLGKGRYYYSTTAMGAVNAALVAKERLMLPTKAKE